MDLVSLLREFEWRKVNKMTREEAIARIKDHMSVHKIYEERAVKITEALNMAISALQQPEIILCKDCIWHNEDTNQCTRQICAEMYDDDFCSRAERREE